MIKNIAFLCGLVVSIGSLTAFAEDELFSPIHCGTAKDILITRPLIGNTKLTLTLSNTRTRTYVPSESVWSVALVGDKEITFKSRRNKASHAAEKILATKFMGLKNSSERVCIQYDSSLAKGYRLGAGSSDDEAVAELSTQ